MLSSAFNPTTGPEPRAALPPSAPLCPVCNGSLVPLGGQFRCGRCHFTVCEGCDGAAAGSGADDE